MLGKNQLSYYHDESQEVVGTIYLKDIGSVLTNKRTKFGAEFTISAANWLKRGNLQEDMEFHFMAQTEDERDEWITTIELLKSLAVQEDVASNFGTDLSFFKSTPSVPLSQLNDESTIDRKSPPSAEEQNKLKDSIKGGFNYLIAHFMAHMIEHAYSNPKPLSQTPVLIESLTILNTIKERNGILFDSKPADAEEVKQGKEVGAGRTEVGENDVEQRHSEEESFEPPGEIDESVIHSEESDVMVSVNQSGAYRRAALKEITFLPFTEAKKDTTIEGISPISLAKPKRLWKYNEGLEGIIGIDVTGKKYISERNDIVIEMSRKGGKRKDKSIVEMQRSKMSTLNKTAVSMDVLIREMRGFLRDKLLHSKPSERFRLQKFKEAITARSERKEPLGSKLHNYTPEQKSSFKELPYRQQTSSRKYGLVIADATSLGGDMFQLKQPMSE